LLRHKSAIIMPAGAATRQQKDGAIGAANDQQEHNAGKKKRQGVADILLKSPDDGLQRKMPVLGEGPGMLFRKLPRKGPRARRWRRQV
jgi:hypothetical protein